MLLCVESEGAKDASKALEVTAELSTNQTEESFRHHRDSASTLGLTSSARSGASQQVIEMRSTSEGPAPSEPAIPTVAMQGEVGGEKEALGKSFEVSSLYVKG